MDVHTSCPGGVFRQGLHFTLSRFQAGFVHRAAGYTLIDLMITLAVLAVLFGGVVPGMQHMLTSTREAAHVNQLVGALALTRSEAVMRNVDTVLCTSTDGRHCTRQGGWEQGWIIFADGNANRRHEAQEPLVRVQGALSTGYTVRYAAFGSRHYVVFFPNGFTRTNGTFTFCNPRQPALARAVVLSKTGRPRLSKTRPDGSPLRCPT